MDGDQSMSGGIPPRGGAGPPSRPGMSAGELSTSGLLAQAHLAGAHDLPDLVARHADTLGGRDAVIYLTDLQQNLLVPFVSLRAPGRGAPLGVDSTVAGRAFRHLQPVIQGVDAPGGGRGGVRIWLPLLDGSERLGVLGVSVEDPATLDEDNGLLTERLQRLASLVAELVMTKTKYGDTIVRLRRAAPMGLAAEIQWSLLPPLSFIDEEVTVVGALEPAYDVAGDSVDYAVDAGVARFAVFDGMGHGLGSAQLVSLVVAAYRNARRAGRPLLETARHVDSAVTEVFLGEAFSTGVLGELDTRRGIFAWVSAGHLEPLVLRGGRLVRTLELDPSLPFGLGRGLGATHGPAQVGSEQLQPGDLLLLYTDGAIEGRSPSGEFFGLERLVDIVVRNLATGMPMSETVRRVVQAMLAHQQGDLSDDATVLVVQWHGGRDR